jgi:serine/threonine protein phosphatase PrpC
MPGIGKRRRKEDRQRGGVAPDAVLDERPVDTLDSAAGEGTASAIVDRPPGAPADDSTESAHDPSPPLGATASAISEVVPIPAPLQRDTLMLGLDPIRRIEPKLQASSSPYRTDTAVDGGIGHGLTLRAAAVRGRAKRFQGRAREDDFYLLASAARRVVVVAVADGMGAAERSGLGAALAVRHAVEAVEEQLAERAPESLDWSQIFNRAAAALVVEHRKREGGESYDRPDRDETKAVSRDLGTTLTIAVIEAEADGKARAHIAAIGDSPAYRLAEGAYELLVGERETDEDFSTSSVVALPYLPQPEVREVQLGAADVLLVCTDGFSGPLGGGKSDVGRLFARELAVPPPLALWPQLVDFAKATYDDDRTVVAVWPFEFTAEETGTDPTPAD